jgi:hypothetical protein
MKKPKSPASPIAFIAKRAVPKAEHMNIGCAPSERCVDNLPHPSPTKYLRNPSPQPSDQVWNNKILPQPPERLAGQSAQGG